MTSGTPSTRCSPVMPSTSRSPARSAAASTSCSRMIGRTTSIGGLGAGAWLAMAASWVAILALDATGDATGLHHHALIEGDTPPAQAIVLFLPGLELMLAAM